MGIHNKRVLGINITIDDKEHILEHIKKYLEKGKRQKAKGKSEEIKPFVIFTPNPEIITYAQKDEKFKQTVTSAQINIPDGIGVVWALRKLYGLNVKRLSGADLMLDLCIMAEKEGLTVGLIGGGEGVALEVRECLLEKYPNLKVKVFEAPEIESGKDTSGVTEWAPPMVEELENIDILFVALGFPKQEFFIESVKRKALSEKLERPLVLMAVGGTFDYLAGRSIRAPGWVRNIGLEWLYRLIHEPWRLPRQLEGGKFFLQVLTSK